MEISGSRIIAAPRHEVWMSLNDPDILRQCIPGCQEMTGSTGEGFEAVVTQKVGPVKATFRGTVTISDLVEAESYTISGEGKGGVAGFAKGSARVTLADVQEGTELSYEVDARVGGKIAQLGSRLITGTARKFADRFFSAFQAAVEGEDEQTTDGGAGT